MLKYLERYIWDNPILTGEFKRRVRTNKLFITQTFFLGFLVTVVYLNWMDTYSYSYYRDPSYMGTQLFRMILLIQFGAISLLCPSFTCTNISSEIEKKTFDLLLTSLLSSREIISGKINSTIIYLAMFLVSSIPVSCVVFFFGGISPLDLFLSYIFIFLGAVLISMIGLFISARTGKTNLSIVISYSVTFALFIFACICISELFDSSNNNNFTRLIDFHIISIPLWLLFLIELISLIFILFISTASLIEVIYPNKNVKIARIGFMIFYIINGLFLALKISASTQSSGNLRDFYYIILFFSILVLPFFIYDKFPYKKGIFRWIYYPDHRFSYYFIQFIIFVTIVFSDLLLFYVYTGVRDRIFIITSSAFILIFTYSLTVVSKYISGFFKKEEPFIGTTLSLYWVPIIVSYFVRSSYHISSGEIPFIIRLMDPFLIIKATSDATVEVMPEISVIIYLVIAAVFNILLYARRVKREA